MKEVMVKITTNQVNEQGEEDIMEFVTEAKLYKRGEAVYLIYEETELSGIPGCRTRLKCKPDEVQMKRYGEGAALGTRYVSNGEDGIPAFMIRRLERSSLRC